VLGVLRRHDQVAVPSRHLGLIPASELGRDATDAVAALTAVVAASVDLEAVAGLARSAVPLPEFKDSYPERSLPPVPRPLIAVAGGKAFTFGYAEHPELLTAAGAEVVTFDPLRDEALPESADGLIIGGGFPEEHAADLSANSRLRTSVAALCHAGAPVIAECAGLLYLARSLDEHPMCGVLDASAVMTDRLTLGYRDAVAAATSPLAPAGTRVHGHEFHRSTIRPGSGSGSGSGSGAGGSGGSGSLGADEAGQAWHWRAGGASVAEGFVYRQTHASFLHTHWAGVPGAAERIVASAHDYRKARTGRV
jgi:cobyrinic acid a,c-diamide synthase